MKNQPKQPIQQCHSRDTTPSTALTSRAAKASAIVAAVVFFFASGCGSVPVPIPMDIGIGTDKEVARAACVPRWTQDEVFDLMWTGVLVFRDRGIDGGELFLAVTDGCYGNTCYDPACTQACIICLGEMVRSAYGLE